MGTGLVAVDSLAGHVVRTEIGLVRRLMKPTGSRDDLDDTDLCCNHVAFLCIAVCTFQQSGAPAYSLKGRTNLVTATGDVVGPGRCREDGSIGKQVRICYREGLVRLWVARSSR